MLNLGIKARPGRVRKHQEGCSCLHNHPSSLADLSGSPDVSLRLAALSSPSPRGIPQLILTPTESPHAWRPQHCGTGRGRGSCVGRSCPCLSCPQEGLSLLSPILLCLAGVSAALIFQQEVQAPSTPLRVVFDGDAVLFSDETDQIFQERGLEGAVQYERAMEAVPMGEVSEPSRFHGHPQALHPPRAFLALCHE